MVKIDVEESKVERKTSSFVFWDKTRIYIILLTLLCVTLCQMNSLAFNFTVICMNDVVDNHYRHNQTEPHWLELTAEKSVLFSAAAIGGLIGLIPSVPLISSIGLKNIQTISGFISATGCFFFPLAVSINYYAVVICRIIQGVGISVVFTTIGVLPGVWAPNNEASSILAILSCSVQFSNIICMPVSGYLCESSLGWRYIYYIFGGFTYIFFIIFHLTYSDSPKLHKNVSTKEFSKISHGKIEKPREAVPYAAVCKDPCVLSAWVSFFGGNLGYFILALYGPTYLKEILHFDVKQIGYLSALPFVAAAVFKFTAGQISDKMLFLSEKTRFVFFAAISQVGLAAGLLVMAFTPNRVVAQGAYTFAILASALNIMGCYKCVQLRCRQHVHFTLAVASFTAYLVQLLAPLGVSILCPDNLPEQWRLLFITVSAIVICASAPFPVFSSSQPADYC